MGYPILDLNEMNTPTRCYVEYLQALLAEYVRDFGLKVDAPHEDGHVGVFNGRNEKVSVSTSGRCGAAVAMILQFALLSPRLSDSLPSDLSFIASA